MRTLHHLAISPGTSGIFELDIGALRGSGGQQHLIARMAQLCEFLRIARPHCGNRIAQRLEAGGEVYRKNSPPGQYGADLGAPPIRSMSARILASPPYKGIIRSVTS